MNAVTVPTETRFRSLQPVQPAEMIGLWEGEGLPSGHPLDGVLENLRWFGKRFHADMRADALLFRTGPGRLIAVEPAMVPLRLALRFASFGRTRMARNGFSHLVKTLRAKGRTASLRQEALDGVQSAAMVYDRQPIIDHFRRLGADDVVGMMIVEGETRRYFFRLRKAAGSEPT